MSNHYMTVRELIIALEDLPYEAMDAVVCIEIRDPEFGSENLHPVEKGGVEYQASVSGQSVSSAVVLRPY